MPPVAAQIGKHAGNVSYRRNTRSGEDGASIGMTPVLTAVGGLEDVVDIVVGEATAAFVHTCDVHSPAASHITRDLHVADEAGVTHCYRAVPRGAGISGKGDEEAPPPTLKLFQETYSRPKNGEDGLLSANPDSRSSRLLV